jgi:hypothetical protein
VNAPVPYIDFDELEEPAPVQVVDVPQGSEDWKLARCGFITGSRISDMMAQGNGESRKKYLYELAIERLTGKPRPEGFKSKRMEQGNILEPAGRELYEFYYDDVREVGFGKHPTIANFGASPDGIIGERGGLELKNRDLRIHLDLYFSRKPPRAAMLQMFAEMSCWNLDYVDYGSYNLDGLPSHLQLVVVRVERSTEEISVIENAVKKFDSEINEMVRRLEATK